MKPLDGARTSGAMGFIKGVGLGVAGIIAKPAAGISSIKIIYFYSLGHVYIISRHSLHLRSQAC